MGDQDEASLNVGDQLQHQLNDRIAGVLVKIAGRFVGKDQRRPGGERATDGDPLLLTAGELFPDSV